MSRAEVICLRESCVVPVRSHRQEIKVFTPTFVIKGIDREGCEVLASSKQFNSVYRAELETLEFYGDIRFKFVWVERQGYGRSSPEPG